jgi:hypothetical protein
MSAPLGPIEHIQTTAGPLALYRRAAQDAEHRQSLFEVALGERTIARGRMPIGEARAAYEAAGKTIDLLAAGSE